MGQRGSGEWWVGPALGVALAVLGAVSAGPVAAQGGGAPAGQIKVVRGRVRLERSGVDVPAPVGTRVMEGDQLVTGSDGSVGIGFADGSALSIGPDSTLVIDRFAFDPTTHRGVHETSLRHGTLVGVSGAITKQTPEAMKVRTPVAILGARGTVFAVRAD